MHVFITFHTSGMHIFLVSFVFTFLTQCKQKISMVFSASSVLCMMCAHIARIHYNGIIRMLDFFRRWNVLGWIANLKRDMMQFLSNPLNCKTLVRQLACMNEVSLCGIVTVARFEFWLRALHLVANSKLWGTCVY